MYFSCRHDGTNKKWNKTNHAIISILCNSWSENCLIRMQNDHFELTDRQNNKSHVNLSAITHNTHQGVCVSSGLKWFYFQKLATFPVNKDITTGIPYLFTSTWHSRTWHKTQTNNFFRRNDWKRHLNFHPYYRLKVLVWKWGIKCILKYDFTWKSIESKVHERDLNPFL